MKKLREHATVKSIVGIVLLLVIFTVIVSIIGYHSFTDAIMEQYSEGAFMTAESAVRHLDSDRMDVYADSGGLTAEYCTVWEQLDELCNSTGSTFIYVIRPDLSDYAHITFIFSTINHESSYNVSSFGYVRDTTNDEYKHKYAALYNKESVRELVIRDKGYIETDPHITAMVPVVKSNGEVTAILCVQRQMDVLANVRHSFLRKISLALLLLVILVIIGQSSFLHHTLLKPLKLISDEAARFSSENTASETKLRDVISNRDEVGQLAGSIDRMEEQVQIYVENLTKITKEKERISTELSLASRIQADMLPNIYPAFPNRPEFEIYGSMDPAKEVGGDFYDFFLVDEDHLCLVIADVSGKGIPAALFMMASKILIANNAMMGKSPAQILTDANTLICSSNREDMFVTVWLGILEISTGRLSAANAGHEYPVIYRKSSGQFDMLKDIHGLVIGSIGGIKYKEYSLMLAPGDKLFLYTDGVPEATNADKELFGTKRMLQALNADKEASPEQVLSNIRRAVDEFVDGEEQFDDLTMLCIKYIQK